MHRIFKILLTAAAILSATTMAARDRDKTIYAFGFGTCLGDTTVYLSEIQVLDSATINRKTGFLEQREVYSRQMEQALRQRYGKHFTCTIFYAEKKSKAEKQYVNLRKHLNKDKALRPEVLTGADFRFTAASTPNL